MSVTTVSAIAAAMRTAEVAVMPTRQAIAVLVTWDAASKTVALAQEGDTDSVLAYAALHDSKTEGWVIKFGNEARILPDADTAVTYVPQSVLLSNLETLRTDVKWVSTCMHQHDQEKTLVTVSWYIRVMKPGAGSFSGICYACNQSGTYALDACIGGTRDDKIGANILGKIVARGGSCHEKNEVAKAAAAKAAADKKAAKAAAGSARVLEAAKAAVTPEPAVTPEVAKKAPAKRAPRKTA